MKKISKFVNIVNLKIKEPSALILVIVVTFGIGFFMNKYLINLQNTVFSSVSNLTNQTSKSNERFSQIYDELIALKNEDQFKRNEDLNNKIKIIESTYDKSILVYEDILDLSDQKVKVDELLKDFTKSVALLADQNYEEAEKILNELNEKIKTEQNKLAASQAQSTQIAAAPINNNPPNSGYSRQTVETSVGSFTIDIIAADLNSTRVLVDTAADSDCSDNCPVLSVGEYASRSGAFAAINGSYFCPASYPSCAGKTNSFDTLLMNKNKTYFNSDNNVYSTIPAAIFYGNTSRFVSKSLEWGRDASVDSVIANQALLTFNNSIAFSGDGDPKKGSRAGRSFIGATGSTSYMGVVRNATVAEAAIVLNTLGIHNSLNLDSGGSTALWFNGAYKAGPGRNIPNAVLFVKK